MGIGGAWWYVNSYSYPRSKTFQCGTNLVRSSTHGITGWRLPALSYEAPHSWAVNVERHGPLRGCTACLCIQFEYDSPRRRIKHRGRIGCRVRATKHHWQRHRKQGQWIIFHVSILNRHSVVEKFRCLHKCFIDLMLKYLAGSFYIPDNLETPIYWIAMFKLYALTLSLIHISEPTRPY